jgi:hypothetical protein
MARALTAGAPTRRRALFGLLDADGWGWASVKAFAWFVVIILMLGYIPDRAYYFTVSRTIDLGLVMVSPVNLCPPEPNGNLPCPAPAGAVTPWQRSPQEIELPGPRVDAAFHQVGNEVLLIGGSDGQTATDSVLVARASGVGNFDRWSDGPALPEPRADAAVASLNGVIYVAGGYGPDGSATSTTYVLKPDLQAGSLGEWQTAEDLDEPIDLPEARTGASLVALSDGLLLVGGAGPDGQPTKTVWKSKVDNQGKLGEWTPQAELFHPTADGVAVLNGDFVWLLGGRDANGPIGLVQRGSVGTAGLPSNVGTGDPGGADSGADGEPGQGGAVGGGVSPDQAVGSPQPGASPDLPADAEAITRWAINDAANLPAARADAMGFAANGSIYLIGGSDGEGTHNQTWWAVPAPGAQGDDIPEWKHLEQSDLPAPGLARAAIGQSGPNLFVLGGVSGNDPQGTVIRTNLAPQEPFFRLGLAGATVPALKIEGEIGQQLGYLNAAGAGGAMFVVLIVIGYMFAHREQTARAWARLRSRRRS